MTAMNVPENGVTIRMYRHGHGDCFLLGFPRKQGAKPVYVLIDCGYKPGSQNFLHRKSIGEIVEHIAETTDRKLDLVIVTHEHQDHVNGFWKKVKPYFEDFTIQEAWFAWTEDPNDDLANELRAKHKDQLLTLIEARNQLALAVGETNTSVRRLDDLLALEIGGDAENVMKKFPAASDPEKSANKQGMRLVREKADTKCGAKYLSPSCDPVKLPSSRGVRVFVLGPPRSADLLTDEDPVGDEAFPGDHSIGHGFGFSAAVRGIKDNSSKIDALFRSSYRVSAEIAMEYVARSRDDSEVPFFSEFYGAEPENSAADDMKEVRGNAMWRRIDGEWLYAAEDLALKLNRGVNNSSLVLAFELPESKKVLLFVGDAQRGNWISWTDNEWEVDDETITVRDLLARTVLYKVGHHGSHNATLNGTTDDVYANLSWMGHGPYAGEFTSMITAVNEWAMTKNNPPWRHPLKSIREALDKKCRGRVFQIDSEPKRPRGVYQSEWDAFLTKTTVEDMYFDYVILDE